MAKVKSSLSCPACRQELLEVRGHCAGVLVKCSACGATILVDIDENGRMVLKYEPVQIATTKSIVSSY